MPRSAKLPKYSLHKATGQARVFIDGRDHYLGEYGSPESHSQYKELIERWERRRNLSQCPRLTVGDLVVLYDAHAEIYYRKNGKPTSELTCVRHAMTPLLTMYRREMASEFGPLKLERVRDRMISLGWSRRTINRNVRRICRMFRWGVEKEKLPGDAHARLAALSPLEKGRSEARETSPIRPVEESAIEATLPFCPEMVASMILVQKHTGMRPAEVVQMRSCDIDRSGEAWVYVPSSHKTEHHGKDRPILIGPKGQAILRPLLLAAAHDGYLFPTANGRCYSSCSYRRAIHRACKRAGLPIWSPNRIRHKFATEVRREHGIESAQVMLGHSNLKTTEVYAESDLSKAREVILRVG